MRRVSTKIQSCLNILNEVNLATAFFPEPSLPKPPSESVLAPGAADYVERVALFFEDEGFSRTAGRLFGCLLLSPAPRSLDQLARALQASKASVSTESRLLERRGIVERVRRPADRRIYYQVPADLPARTMELRLDRMRRFSGLIRAVPARPRRASTVVDARFRDIDAAYTLMIAALAGALAEWRRRPVRRRIARRASPS